MRVCNKHATVGRAAQHKAWAQVVCCLSHLRSSGDIFTFEQRAKIQGVFSGVWGVSSVIGPLIGGFLVDHASWQLVFFLNIPLGILAAIMMTAAWRDVTPRTHAQVDFIGAGLLTGGIVTLLIALSQLNEPRGWELPAFWILLVTSAALFALMFWVERRAPNPILPIALFRDRLFAAAAGHGLLSGFAIFGMTAFIPFFGQSVLGVSATAAGAVLTPQMVAWVAGSIISSRLLLRYGYRSIAMLGVTFLTIGSAMMTQVGAHTPLLYLYVAVGICGLGMGFTIPSFTIAVQSSVARQAMGTATSTLQFSRNIGGAIGVSVLGVILTWRLDEALTIAGLDPKQFSLGQLLDRSSAASVSLVPIRDSLASAVELQFILAFVVVIGAWFAASIAPRGRVETKRVGEQEGASQPAAE
jgi:MFS family permease